MLAYNHGDSVAIMPQPEFDLLLRSVELVVLSQAFSESRLGLALRVPPIAAHRMTELLEQWRIIGAPDYDGGRRVLAPMRQLSAILFRMREQRGSLASAA